MAELIEQPENSQLIPCPNCGVCGQQLIGSGSYRMCMDCAGVRAKYVAQTKLGHGFPLVSRQVVMQSTFPISVSSYLPDRWGEVLRYCAKSAAASDVATQFMY